MEKRGQLNWRESLHFITQIMRGLKMCIRDRYVAPGGVLVYSTCTILPEENEQVTDAFLTEHSDFCRDGFTLPAPVGETEGQLTLWPQRHGTDGFYICRMKRK